MPTDADKARKAGRPGQGAYPDIGLKDARMQADVGLAHTAMGASGGTRRSAGVWRGGPGTDAAPADLGAATGHPGNDRAARGPGGRGAAGAMGSRFPAGARCRSRDSVHRGRRHPKPTGFDGPAARWIHGDVLARVGTGHLPAGGLSRQAAQQRFNGFRDAKRPEAAEASGTGASYRGAGAALAVRAWGAADRRHADAAGGGTAGCGGGRRGGRGGTGGRKPAGPADRQDSPITALAEASASGGNRTALAGRAGYATG